MHIYRNIWYNIFGKRVISERIVCMGRKVLEQAESDAEEG